MDVEIHRVDRDDRTIAGVVLDGEITDLENGLALNVTVHVASEPAAARGC